MRVLSLYSVQWHPDGATFVSGFFEDNDGEDLGRHQRQLLEDLDRSHLIMCSSVAYSPDGQHIISGSADNSIKIWDAATGNCLQTLTGHTRYLQNPMQKSVYAKYNKYICWVWSVAYSPDGQHIISGSGDKSVKIWDAATGNCLQTLTGHTSHVFSVAYSPDGQHIVSGSFDKSVKIWDAATGNCLQTLTGHTWIVSSVAYSPDGQHIISGSFDNSIKIWDAATGNCLQTLTGHTSFVYSVAYSPDGQHILSGSLDKSVKIWDAATGNCLQTLTGHTASVQSVAYSPDGQHILSGSDDRSIRVWDAQVPRSMVV